MPRSLVTIDLAAIRHNVRTLRGLLDGAELWAVVKADGYGHGAVDVGRAALEAGATALGVATLGEALELRDGAAGRADRRSSARRAPAEVADGPRGPARAVRLGRRRPRGRPRPPEARHGHGAVGALGARRARARASSA